MPPLAPPVRRTSGQTLSQLGGTVAALGQPIEQLIEGIGLSRAKSRLKSELASKYGKLWGPQITEATNQYIDRINDPNQFAQVGLEFAKQARDFDESPGGKVPEIGLKYETWADENSKIRGLAAAQAAAKGPQIQTDDPNMMGAEAGPGPDSLSGYQENLRGQLSNTQDPTAFAVATQAGKAIGQTFPQQQKPMTQFQQAQIEESKKKTAIAEARADIAKRKANAEIGKVGKPTLRDYNTTVRNRTLLSDELNDIVAKIANEKAVGTGVLSAVMQGLKEKKKVVEALIKENDKHKEKIAVELGLAGGGDEKASDEAVRFAEEVRTSISDMSEAPEDLQYEAAAQKILPFAKSRGVDLPWANLIEALRTERMEDIIQAIISAQGSTGPQQMQVGRQLPAGVMQ